MKKIKQFVGVLLLILTLWLGASPVLAANLAVTSIGVEDTSTDLDSFTYSEENPTIVGTASPEAEVDITIDDLTTTVVADEDGDWSYTPTSLTAGEYDVEISSNLETLTFTLTISSSSTEDSTSSASTGVGGATDSSSVSTSSSLPQSGTGETMILLVAAGFFLIGLSAILQSQKFSLVESIEETDLNQ